MWNFVKHLSKIFQIAENCQNLSKLSKFVKQIKKIAKSVKVFPHHSDQMSEIELSVAS